MNFWRGTEINAEIYQFAAEIEPVPDKHGAFVRFPYDIRKEFGKGRVKVRATFDGEPYEGSLVNMGSGTLMAPSAISSASGRTSKRKSERAPATPSP